MISLTTYPMEWHKPIWLCYYTLLNFLKDWYSEFFLFLICIAHIHITILPAQLKRSLFLTIITHRNMLYSKRFFNMLALFCLSWFCPSPPVVFLVLHNKSVYICSKYNEVLPFVKSWSSLQKMSHVNFKVTPWFLFIPVTYNWTAVQLYLIFFPCHWRQYWQWFNCSFSLRIII